MKKFILVLCAIITCTQILAQKKYKYNAQFTYSNLNHLGFAYNMATPKGITIGLGISYNINPYFGETNGKYSELALQLLGNDGYSWTNEFVNKYSVVAFVENRASSIIQFGYTKDRWAFLLHLGANYRTMYWKGKNYENPMLTSPEKNFYVFKNISPNMAVGGSVTYKTGQKIGFTAGYNTSQNLFLGVTIASK